MPAPRAASNAVTVSATPSPAYAQSTVTAHIHTTGNGSAVSVPVVVTSTSTPSAVLTRTDSSGNLDLPFKPSLGSWTVTAKAAAGGAGLMHNTLGDSITAGIGATSESMRYVNRVAAFYQTWQTNYGRIGDQACDEFPHIVGPSITTHLNTPVFYSDMIGTNDADLSGAGAYESNFKTCFAAVLAWLATPQEAMVLPGSVALSGTGGWSAAATNYYATTGPNYDVIKAAIAPSGSAGTLLATLATQGAPLYGWYMIDDHADANACFSLTVDGTAAGNFCTKPTTPLKTANGSTSSVAFFRIPVAAGAHTVVASTSTGGVALVALGSLPAAGSWTKPILLSNDVPSQISTGPVAPLSTQLAYNADVLAQEAMLNADGAGILHVPNRSFMTSDPANFSDAVHPNDTGMAQLALAELSVLESVPGYGVVSGSATVPVNPNAVSVSLSTSTTTASSAQGIPYSAAVTDTTGSAAPQGTLRILDGSSAVATVNLAGGTTSTDSVSDTLSLPYGQHTLVAQFTPATADFQSASSSPVTVSISPSQPHVTLTPVSSTTMTINGGQSTTVKFNLVSVDGYQGTVQLSCGPLPTPTLTCQFAQSQYTVAAGSTTPVQLTLSASYMTVAGIGQTGPRGPWPLTLMLFGGVALLPLARSSKVRRRLLAGALPLCTLAAACVLLNGCAGGRAPRQYQIAVTAAANPTGTVAPSPLTLNVTVTQ